jgi:hypothetical protein
MARRGVQQGRGRGVREGSEHRGCDRKAAAGLALSEVKMRCDVSTSVQVAEGFHGSRPMWMWIGCRMSNVLHSGSDLDGDAQRGGPGGLSQRTRRIKEGSGAQELAVLATKERQLLGRECHSQRQGIPLFHATMAGWVTRSAAICLGQEQARDEISRHPSPRNSALRWSSRVLF